MGLFDSIKRGLESSSVSASGSNISWFCPMCKRPEPTLISLAKGEGGQDVFILHCSSCSVDRRVDVKSDEGARVKLCSGAVTQQVRNDLERRSNSDFFGLYD